jgi:hypothetical protein
MNTFKQLATTLVVLLCAFSANSQAPAIIGQDTLRNPIITAVPFIGITPDARSAGMGEAGVAISPDAHASYWNVGKLGFMEQESGMAFSYTPWLQKIVGDMNLVYLTGFKKLSDFQTVSASLRYFDLGSLTFTDASGGVIRPFNPREFTIDAAYGLKLSDNLGLGVAGRYIYSNLSGGISASTLDTRPGSTFGIDLGVYYEGEAFDLGQYPANLSLGANISNIGFKITYSNQNQQDFIPTNLRLGGALTTNFDPYNKLTFALDFNKLLVPTPTYSATGQLNSPSLFSGIFGSFSDAPGGFSEELQEINLATGLEYWYNDLFAARAGFFYEPSAKGGRQYATLGLGLRYQLLQFDFAYLVPSVRNHPLEDTIRFSLLFNFGRDGQSSTTPSGGVDGI